MCAPLETAEPPDKHSRAKLDRGSAGDRNLEFGLQEADDSTGPVLGLNWKQI